MKEISISSPVDLSIQLDIVEKRGNTMLIEKTGVGNVAKQLFLGHFRKMKLAQ